MGSPISTAWSRAYWTATLGAPLAGNVGSGDGDAIGVAEPLTLAEYDGCLGEGECWTRAADAAWPDRWTGWGYRWNGGVVLTGVRLDEHEHLGLFVQAVDRRGRPDLRLDEVGDGWARDKKGWLQFRTGIPVRSSGAALEPLRSCGDEHGRADRLAVEVR